VLAACAALVCAACAPDTARLEADGSVVVTRVWLHHSASAEAPPSTDPGWRPAELPDYWGLGQRAQGTVGWYRLELARPAAGPSAVALTGDWESLEVELDGTRLLRGGALRTTLGDPRAGLLLPLPERAPGAEPHTIALRFETAAWRIGYLDPVVIGPTQAVLAHHDRTAVLQPTLRVSLAALAAACGVVLALLGRWDATGAAPWLAAGTVLWSASALPPWPWLAQLGSGFVMALCMHSFPVPFAIGLHRKLGVLRPRRETALVAITLLPAAVRLLVPPLFVPLVDGLWWIVALGIGFYLLRLAYLVARRGSLERSGFLLVATGLALAAGIHDLASLALARAPLGVFLFQFAPGVLALATVAMLVGSLGTRLGFAERLNVELEDRVEARRRELAASYARMAELERDGAIAAERARLMRDMHDGTGGALVSAIAMAEAGDAAPAIAEVLRDALADLRLSIDSLDPAEPDLVSLLAAARARLEPRFEGRGVRIAWDVREVPRPAGFGPESALQVLRIFQEAVVNAMRHSGARTVTVRTRDERDADGRAWVALDVADDGAGFDPGAEAPHAGGGRGLGNMRRRAAALGGELAVESAASGTCVRLRMPVDAPEAKATSPP
jgi:hypothetical protein